MAATGEAFWKRLCMSHRAPRSLRRTDSRLPSRAKNRKALNDKINAALKAKTDGQWVEILNEAEIPCGPIFKMDQVFADEQMQHLKVTSDVEHPRLGKLHDPEPDGDLETHAR